MYNQLDTTFFSLFLFAVLFKRFFQSAVNEREWSGKDPVEEWKNADSSHI